MKFLFFYVLLNIASVTAFSQNCKLDVDSKDKFSGEVYRKIDQRMGSITTHWNVIIEQKADNYFIALKHISTDYIKTSVSKGDKFYLKLDNEKVLTFTANDDYTNSYYAANGGAQTTVMIKGEVSQDILSELSNSSITDMRITLGGKDYIQSKIPTKQAKSLSKSVLCLISLR